VSTESSGHRLSGGLVLRSGNRSRGLEKSPVVSYYDRSNDCTRASTAFGPANLSGDGDDEPPKGSQGIDREAVRRLV